ncbi:hypothetical protein [Marinicella gelatinilytica]|uniref:hypothetical protein n=1 Tax=Marinicella gelatinilytica TaxID=2996017 RepID=UPI002260B355|nr:hypothetical protein [Marinicella gelatinilytica]MCX7544076.1 hypothetical protein [Marinicella gelatinilytica]
MKKNKLTTAVIAGLAGVAGVASVGNAVHVNPEGTGQVLVYPYYTVNGLDTTYSVVNTTDQAKAVKVRFLEGENSREVLDFNVYLSPFDVWTGALTATESTIGDHAGEKSAVHLTNDTSCAPRLKKMYNAPADAPLNQKGQEFLPYEIDKDWARVSGVLYSNTDLERSTEGHFEVIEMGVVTGVHAALLTHENGVPAFCGGLDISWDGGDWPSSLAGLPQWDNNPNYEIEAATGGLFGGASLIDVANGFNVSYDATALDDFWPMGGFEHTNPGSLAPSLNSGDTRSVVFSDGVATPAIWDFGYQAVSAVFMRDRVYNEYSFEDEVEGKSQWVVNFPTKFHHVNGLSAPVEPFGEEWWVFSSCDEFEFRVYDREEMYDTSTGGISPPPPDSENPEFCYETNTVEFVKSGGSVGSSNILGSPSHKVTTLFGVSKPGATQSGWARLEFNSNQMTSLDNVTYQGLPVAGFLVDSKTNKNAQPGLLAKYGGLFNHKGRINSGQ